MSHPQAVLVQLGTRCNARCVNCPYASTYGRLAEHASMSDEIWGLIVDDLAREDYCGQVGLYLHFEPLLEPTLFDRIRDVNDNTRAHVVISTNGSLLTDEKIGDLIDSRPRLVHVNINSGDPEQYAAMTGLDFDRTVGNTRRLIEAARGSVEIEINCPVMRDTDTEALVGLFPDVKVNVEYWANSRGGLIVDLHDQSLAQRASRFRLASACTQPIVNLNILQDGSYLLCCMDWAHESKCDLPNVRDVPPIAVYNSDYFGARMSEFNRGDYSVYRMCQMCSQEMGFGCQDGDASELTEGVPDNARAEGTAVLRTEVTS